MDYIRRLSVLRKANKFDLILLEKEFFPYIPSCLEMMMLPRGVIYVCDYDDAWFHAYDQHRNPIIRLCLAKKIGKVMGGATSVIAGSEYIAQYAMKYNGDVHRLPTVIDLDLYPPAHPGLDPDAPFTIGWIGSQTTISHLKTIESVLDEFCSGRNARVIVIGPSAPPLNIRSLEVIPWARETEVLNLSKIHVGIMPLPDTAFERGKCAFKLIQYMGCWKPVVASPVGENRNVVKQGENGFLANTREEWLAALDRLYRDRELGMAMGVAGRESVERNYSLSVVAPRFVEVLQRAASGVGKTAGKTR